MKNIIHVLKDDVRKRISVHPRKMIQSPLPAPARHTMQSKLGHEFARGSADNCGANQTFI